MNFIKKIRDYLLLKRNPISYWKKKGLIIGNNCEVYNTAEFSSEPYLIEIGDNVRINSGVTFVTHDGGVWVLRNSKEECKDSDFFGKIKVGNNVHIGTNSIIMPNVTIGNNCIVGCGSIVTKSVPDNTIVAGVPARQIESIEEYYKKKKDKLVNTKHMNPIEKKDFLIKIYNQSNEK